MKLSKTTALLNQPVLVSTALHATNPRDGLLVTFYDGDPAKGGKPFEVERLAHIRGNDAHQVRVLFRPDRCGTHNLFARVHPGGKRVQTKLDVTINPVAAVRKMLKWLQQIFPRENRSAGILVSLREAQKLFQQKDNAAALQALEKFQARVTNQRGQAIPADQADLLLAQIEQIFDCVKP